MTEDQEKEDSIPYAEHSGDEYESCMKKQSLGLDDRMESLGYDANGFRTKFLERLLGIFEGFKGIYYPKHRSYAKYIGKFRVRKEDDVLDEGEEIFEFCNQEILGKEIQEVALKFFKDEFDKWVETDKAKDTFGYEYIIEFGSADEYDKQEDENKNVKIISSASRDYYPELTEEEFNKRLILKQQKFNEEIKKSREELAKASDMITNLQTIVNEMEKELEKKDNIELRKKCERFKKNINALKTFDNLKNIKINLGKQYKKFENNGEEVFRILGIQVNEILRKDDKTQYDYRKLRAMLGAILNNDAMAKDFIIRVLMFTKQDNLKTYKIFTIKTFNDLLKLKFNYTSESGKEFIKRVKSLYEKK